MIPEALGLSLNHHQRYCKPRIWAKTVLGIREKTSVSCINPITYMYSKVRCNIRIALQTKKEKSGCSHDKKKKKNVPKQPLQVRRKQPSASTSCFYQQRRGKIHYHENHTPPNKHLRMTTFYHTSYSRQNPSTLVDREVNLADQAVKR